MNRWNPATHDPLLIDLHRQGHIDLAIANLMLDQGHAIAKADVSNARRRLSLKANTPVGAREHKPDAYKDKPNPLTQAKLWLGKRLVEKPSGYWLDGLPASMNQLMQEFNRMRLAAGAAQIDTNQAWKVPE